MMNRKSTRQDWCSFRKINKSGEVNSPLSDLHSLLLAFVLVIPPESLPLRLSRLGALLGEVIRTSALETAVVVVRARYLLHIWPWAILLLLRLHIMILLLLRWHITILLQLLLRRSDDPTPLLRGSLRGCS